MLAVGCGQRRAATLPPTPPQTAKKTVTIDSTKTSVVDPESVTAKPARRIGWVRKALVNVRSSPTPTAPIVAKLARGTEVALIAREDQWWKIELAADSLAYIHESMVSTDKYVDPWTQFRNGCRLADTTLHIIVSVTEVKESEATSAAMTVMDDWANLSKVKRQRVAQAAFAYWKICLQKSGYDVKGAVVLLRDEEGVDLVRVSGTPEKTSVEFLK
jgi:SH3-like domain-containing protein